MVSKVVSFLFGVIVTSSWWAAGVFSDRDSNLWFIPVFATLLFLYFFVCACEQHINDK